MEKGSRAHQTFDPHFSTELVIQWYFVAGRLPFCVHCDINGT